MCTCGGPIVVSQGDSAPRKREGERGGVSWTWQLDAFRNFSGIPPPPPPPSHSPPSPPWNCHGRRSWQSWLTSHHTHTHTDTSFLSNSARLAHWCPQLDTHQEGGRERGLGESLPKWLRHSGQLGHKQVRSPFIASVLCSTAAYYTFSSSSLLFSPDLFKKLFTWCVFSLFLVCFPVWGWVCGCLCTWVSATVLDSAAQILFFLDSFFWRTDTAWNRSAA